MMDVFTLVIMFCHAGADAPNKCGMHVENKWYHTEAECTDMYAPNKQYAEQGNLNIFYMECIPVKLPLVEGEPT